MKTLWGVLATCVLVGLLATAGCGDLGGSDSEANQDPCEGVELPACPAACPANYTDSCGMSCSDLTFECGNNIGDGMSCENGTFVCTVHAPQGSGCNLVCR